MLRLPRARGPYSLRSWKTHTIEPALSTLATTAADDEYSKTVQDSRECLDRPSLTVAELSVRGGPSSACELTEITNLLKLPLSRKAFHHTERAFPSAWPSSAGAGGTYIGTPNSFWNTPFATTFSATPPARHTFRRPVCRNRKFKRADIARSSSDWVQAARLRCTSRISAFG